MYTAESRGCESFRILFVEDDSVLARAMMFLLQQRFPYTCIDCVNCTDDALTLIHNERSFVVALLDVRVPRTRGDLRL